MLKTWTFEGRWLFSELGWVVLRVVPDNAMPGRFLIRGSTNSGPANGTFVWGQYGDEATARHTLAQLTPDTVLSTSARLLGYSLPSR
jgi:hypothetical protein